MRILFVSEYFFPFTPGGGEWSTLTWARILKQQGHIVQVATVNFGAKSLETIEDIDVWRLPFPLKLSPGQKSIRNYATKNLLFYLYFGISLKRFAEKADIIHAQSENALIPAWIASRLANKPAVMTLRDTGLLCPLGGVCLTKFDDVPMDCGVKRLLTKDARYFQKHYLRHQHSLSRANLILRLFSYWFDTLLKQAYLNRMDAIVSVSKGLVDVFPEHVLWDRERVYSVNNPYIINEKNYFRTSDTIKAEWEISNRPVVLTVGKKSLGKGTYDLLTACRQLYQTDKKTVFLLVGKGELRGELPPNVISIPSLAHEKVLELYSIADVVVVPSTWPEPFSRVILEAMWAGKPVIGTNVGGTPEAILHGKTGLLVPPRAPVELKEGIEKLLCNSKQRKVMGTAGRLRVEKQFGPQMLTPELIRVYCDILEKNNEVRI